MLPLLVLLGTVAGAWYLLIVRPQREQQVRHGRLVDHLQVGDHVLTVGGIYGRVVALDGATVALELAPGLTSRIATDGIARIVQSGGGTGAAPIAASQQHGAAAPDAAAAAPPAHATPVHMHTTGIDRAPAAITQLPHDPATDGSMHQHQNAPHQHPHHHQQQPDAAQAYEPVATAPRRPFGAVPAAPTWSAPALPSFEPRAEQAPVDPDAGMTTYRAQVVSSAFDAFSYPGPAAPQQHHAPGPRPWGDVRPVGGPVAAPAGFAAAGQPRPTMHPGAMPHAGPHAGAYETHAPTVQMPALSYAQPPAAGGVPYGTAPAPLPFGHHAAQAHPAYPGHVPHVQPQHAPYAVPGAQLPQQQQYAAAPQPQYAPQHEDAAAPQPQYAAPQPQYAPPAQPVEEVGTRRHSRAPQGMGSSLRLDDPSIADTMERARQERSGLADEYRALHAPLVDTGAAPADAYGQHVGAGQHQHSQQPHGQHSGQPGVVHELFAAPGVQHGAPTASPSAHQYPGPARPPAVGAEGIPRPGRAIAHPGSRAVEQSFQHRAPYVPEAAAHA